MNALSVEGVSILAPGLSPEEAFSLFDAFRLRLAEERFTFDGEQVAITISIGVSSDVVDSLDTMIAAELLPRPRDNGIALSKDRRIPVSVSPTLSNTVRTARRTRLRALVGKVSAPSPVTLISTCPTGPVNSSATSL